MLNQSILVITKKDNNDWINYLFRPVTVGSARQECPPASSRFSEATTGNTSGLAKKARYPGETRLESVTALSRYRYLWKCAMGFHRVDLPWKWVSTDTSNYEAHVTIWRPLVVLVDRSICCALHATSDVSNDSGLFQDQYYPYAVS